MHINKNNTNPKGQIYGQLGYSSVLGIVKIRIHIPALYTNCTST